jgi:hypothetical protein
MNANVKHADLREYATFMSEALVDAHTMLRTVWETRNPGEGVTSSHLGLTLNTATVAIVDRNAPDNARGLLFLHMAVNLFEYGLTDPRTTEETKQKYLDLITQIATGEETTINRKEPYDA